MYVIENPWLNFCNLRLIGPEMGKGFSPDWSMHKPYLSKPDGWRRRYYLSTFKTFAVPRQQIVKTNKLRLEHR